MDKVNTTFEELLDEGLIKSYPTKNFVAQIKRAFQQATDEQTIIGFKFIKDKSLIDIHSDKEIVAVQFMLYDDSKDSLKRFEEEYLNHDLEYLGWFIGNRRQKIERVKSSRWPFNMVSLETQIFFFEPKFPADSTKARKFSKDIIKKYKVFYHMTFEKFQNKIEKNGLVPSFSDRENFKYPERIYLFTDENFAIKFAQYHNTPRQFGGGKNHKDNIELRRIGNTKEVANLKFQKNDQKILIYQVDLAALEKSGKEILLYHDNRVIEPNDNFISAVFTYNSIPPKYLKLVRSISTTK